MVHPFASRHEGPGFNPQGGTCVKPGFSCWCCLTTLVTLTWWSLWPCLRQASSRTVTRPSCQKCDNPTWSHTALMRQFHACCRSSVWFHSRHSWLLGWSPVQSLQSHCTHTQSHWSSGSTLCFPSWGTQIQSPGGGEYLCGTGIFLLALSHYNILLTIWSSQLIHP
jgi:hypothetical protein